MDAKLKKALEAQLMESYEQLMKTDIPDYDFSPDFEIKMAGITADSDSKKGFVIPKAVINYTAFVAAAAAIIGVWGGIASRKDIIDPHYPENNIISYETTTVSNANAVTNQAVTSAVLPKSTMTTAVSFQADESKNTYNYNTSLSSDIRTAVNISAEATDKQEDISVQSNRTEIKRTNTTFSPAVTTVQVSFTTAYRSSENGPERSIDMKKIVSLLAALSIGTAALPSGTVAADYNNFGFSDYMQNDIDTQPLIKALNIIDKDDIDKDINKDGAFDLLDCYVLYAHENYSDLKTDENLTASCEAFIANVTQKSEYAIEKFTFSKLLTNYYLITNGIKADYLFPSYYTGNFDKLTFKDKENDEKSINDLNNKFALSVVPDIKNIPNSYSIIEDLLSRPDVDIDFNGDGSVSVDDIYVFHTFEYNLADFYFQYYSDHKDNYDPETVPDGCSDYQLFESLGEGTVTREQYERCSSFYKQYSAIEYNYSVYEDGKEYKESIISGIDTPELLSYVFKADPILPEYMEEEYYFDIIPNSYASIATSALVNKFKTTQKDTNTDAVFFDNDMFLKQAKDYLNAVDAGIAQIPDMNGDSILNYTDFNILSDFYLKGGEEYPGADKTCITAEQWERLRTDFDLNNDGTSGDIYDIMIAEYFICDKSDNIFQNDELDDLLEGDNYQQNMEILSNLNIKRSGDSNCDNDTGLADALLILQHNANPQKYPLTKAGEFNADVFNTGDGITPMDALEIQKWDAAGSIK